MRWVVGIRYGCGFDCMQNRRVRDTRMECKWDLISSQGETEGL